MDTLPQPTRPPDWDSVVEELDRLVDTLMTIRANGGPAGLAPRQFRASLSKAVTFVSKAGSIARDRAEEEAVAERLRLLDEQRAKGIPEVVGALRSRLRPI